MISEFAWFWLERAPKQSLRNLSPFQLTTIMLTLLLFSPEIIPAKLKPRPVYRYRTLSSPDTLSNHQFRNPQTFFLRRSGGRAKGFGTNVANLSVCWGSSRTSAFSVPNARSA